MPDNRREAGVEPAQPIEKAARTIDQLGERLGPVAVDIVRVTALPVGREQRAALLGRGIEPPGVRERDALVDRPLGILGLREARAQRLGGVDCAAVG